MKASKHLARILALLSLAAGAGCASGPDAPADVETTGAKLPWTQAFLEPCVLVADEIRIEGPEDLLVHVVVAQDDLRIDYVTETTADGLLQVATLREGVARAQISATIDGWDLRAMRRLVVLCRPGEVPVTVRATGEAWWSDGSVERREPTLEFVGERGR